jgi:hypothetical protein
MTFKDRKFTLSNPGSFPKLRMRKDEQQLTLPILKKALHMEGALFRNG